MAIFHKTNYGFRRIARALKRTKGISISYGTVRKILKRNGKLQPKEKKTIRHTGRRHFNPLDFFRPDWGEEFYIPFGEYIIFLSLLIVG